jgi:predicted ATPase
MKDYHFSIKNFGPITEAEFDLKPLTIFIGPNTSGKSYVAKLVTAFVVSLMNMPPFRLPKLKSPDKFDIHKLAQNNRTDLSNKCNTYKQSFVKSWEYSLSETLKRVFSSDLSDICRYGSSESHISILAGEIKIDISINSRGLHVETFVTPDCSIVLIHSDQVKETQFLWDGFNLECRFNEGYLRSSTNYWNLFDSIEKAVRGKYKSLLSLDKYYFPAERIGLVELKEVLTSITMKDDRIGQEIPAIFREFLSDLLLLKNKRGQFKKLASDLSREMLKGEIIIHEGTGAWFFRQNGLTIPIANASSAIGQLSSIILMLSEVIKSGDLMIIEEPEAHLHPANQLILAKNLVRLIREGVNLLITTHSDYMVEQLGAYLVAKSLPDAVRVKKLKYGKGQYLDKNDLAVYSFKPSPARDGFTVKKVNISPTNGIDLREYTKVAEDISDQYVDISLAKNAKK